MALRAAAGGGSSSGGGTWGSITGDIEDQTDLITAINDAVGTPLAAVILGAGPTNITHADHSNRAVSSVQSAPTSVVFAVTATSGAVDGDLVTIDNFGAGTMTASGAIEAWPGFKKWVRTGEILIASYNAAADKYYSRTPDVRRAGNSHSWAVIPIVNTATPTIIGAVSPTAINSSANAGVSTAATNVYTHIQRSAINSNVTTAGAQTGNYVVLSNAHGRFPTATIPYYHKVRVVGSINDAYSAGSFAIGITTATPGAGEPSTYLNSIFLGGDSTDANMFIMSNDGSGNATKHVNLGSSFPNHTNAADMYELTVDLYADGVARYFHWTARNLSSPTVPPQFGTIPSKFPTEGGAAFPVIVRCNQAQNGSTVSVHFGGYYVGSFA